ncbi:MAG: DegV family protein [Spirochaetes bacterium]|nr:DegV family protein [Spirochaetota bacterium]
MTAAVTMNDTMIRACIQGAERVSAWADLLDSINVYPVADGDTGRNLKISLAPLRDLAAGRERAVRALLVRARGNSGNIAARFFSAFLDADTPEALSGAAREGRDRAWKAVMDPKPGTMLTVFDALADDLESAPFAAEPNRAGSLLDRLEAAVRSTPLLLPKLGEAGVVDSGALGMFIFFEGFFMSLTGTDLSRRPVTSVFEGGLSIAPSYRDEVEEGYCLDITLDAGTRSDEARKTLAELGESVVVIPGRNCLKVHLHTGDSSEIRRRMESLGSIISWSGDDLGEQIRTFSARTREQALHVMSDAAGSITRNDALSLGITLLDSYITVGDTAAPETCVDPAALYDAMRRGIRVSTSQASEFERHELYQSALDLHGPVLYLCVGSAYTGNYDVALRWKEEHDTRGFLTVVDTGAASGRLGTIAIKTAEYSITAPYPDAVATYAAAAIEQCREYIFIDNLKYLAAGGRISKPRAFFGTMLNMKPVVAPTPTGVVRAGMARTPEEQIAFALERLAVEAPGSAPFIMLQYTDNRDMVEGNVLPAVRSSRPGADIQVRPFSLTTGVHIGPGAWSIAFLPELSTAVTHG